MKTLLPHLLSRLVETRLIVGAAAAALTVATSRILDVPVSAPLLGAVMAATVVIYTLDRILDRRDAPGPVPTPVTASLIVAGGALLALLTRLAPASALAIVVGLPVCTLYAVPFAFRSSSAPARPKDHPLGKALSVATAVTGATVLLPLLEAGHGTRPTALVVAGSWVFSVLFVNAVACDLRDLDGDRRAGLRTLATRAGARTTRRGLLRASLAIAVASATIAAAGGIPVACAIVAALLLAAISLLRPDRPRWVWSLCLDGVLLPLLLVGLS